MHSERPKLHTILAFLSVIGLKGNDLFPQRKKMQTSCTNYLAQMFIIFPWEKYVSFLKNTIAFNFSNSVHPWLFKNLSRFGWPVTKFQTFPELEKINVLPKMLWSDCACVYTGLSIYIPIAFREIFLQIWLNCNNVKMNLYLFVQLVQHNTYKYTEALEIPST